MKKTVFSVALFSVLNLGAQQISSSKWRDLFSYNNIVSVFDAGDGKLVVAAENGLYYFDPVNPAEKPIKLSKANGLHNVKISALAYDSKTKTGILGYEDGTMDLIKNNETKLIVDIPISNTVDKKINSISITGNLAAIATSYGVSIYNIDSQGFGNTVFIPGGSNGAIIIGNVLYIATNTGLYSHSIEKSQLADFSIFPWTNKIDANNYVALAGKDGVMASATSTSLKIFSDGNPTYEVTGFKNIKGINVSDEIAVADDTGVTFYTFSGTQHFKISTTRNATTGIINKGKRFAGTKNSGIIDENGNTYYMLGNEKFYYTPDGPYNNISYKLHLNNDKIWVSTGGRTAYNNATKPDTNLNLGFYFFNGFQWYYPELFTENDKAVTPTPFNVLDAVPNPKNEDEVFFTNYSMASGQGIYTVNFNNNHFDTGKVYRYDSSLTHNRPVGCTSTEDNNLYCTFAKWTDGTKIGIGKFNGNDFSVQAVDVIEGRVQKPYAYGNKLWIPVPGTADGSTGHLFLVNNTSNTSSSGANIQLNENNNLNPAAGTISSAIDKNGDLWIGTSKGLKIFPNAESAITTPNSQAEPIIITQNGVGEELFRDAAILQIAVDSGNQKWVSVEGGGVFYLSANGEKTYLHFTKANSPLPTNDVTDIKINEKTGEVFFATIKGIVAYKGDVSNVTGNFGEVLVYPNPVVYSQFKGNVKIKGLAETTNIRITDAAGNLLKQDLVRGGYYEWDLNNFRGKRVASGIYFVLMTNADGTDKATAKIAVVN